MQNEILNTETAPAYLKLSPYTLERWRLSADDDQLLKTGTSVRYRKEDLDAFVEQSTRCVFRSERTIFLF